jgi:Flp pilus assembly protein TadG
MKARMNTQIASLGMKASSKLRRRSVDRGTSLLEMAFLVPMMLTLLIGVIELGRFSYFSILVANAARAGVQYGAQSLVTAADNAGMQAAAKNDGQNITGLTVTSTTHYCSCSGTPTVHVTCPATCTSPAHALVYVDVVASGTFTPIFHYPGMPTTFTVARDSSMRVAQ